MKKLIGCLIKIFIFTIMAVNSVSAQTLYREYSDNDVYMFINNAQQKYWIAGPQLPNHELEIRNIGYTTVDVRVLIKVVLRDGQGNYLDETTREKTVTVSPGATKTETIWMDTANKGNAYYCVEGFRVLSVTDSAELAQSRREKYRMSEYGKGYYTVAVDFAYRYHLNVLGDWLPPKEGHIRGTRIYVYGTLASNPQLAVVEISKWVGGDTYMRMCDLVKE